MEQPEIQSNKRKIDPTPHPVPTKVLTAKDFISGHGRKFGELQLGVSREGEGREYYGDRG